MRVEQMPTAHVLPYYRNPRKNEAAVAKVMASIEAFGWRQPIVVDPKNVIVVGHTRLLAALQMGLDTVPVHVAEDLTPAQVKAYRLADNRTGEEADWNTDFLRLELADLELEGMDLALTGFDEDELAGLKLGSGDVTEDEPPEPPEAPVSVSGEIYELGRHRVMCGDSTVESAVSGLLGGAVPFLMVTDPPYGVKYEGGEVNKKKRERLAGDEAADLYEPTFALCPCVVTYTWFAGSKALPVYSAAIGNGYEPRALLIWNKLKAHYAAPSAHYKQRHEPCLYSVKRGCAAKWAGDMTVATVWDIEQPSRNEHHPTQKPVECMARPIRNHGKTGDAVYDPFLGSGTTLIAAEQLGRVCYGVEIDPGYVDVIRQRYANFVKDPEWSPTGVLT